MDIQAEILAAIQGVRAELAGLRVAIETVVTILTEPGEPDAPAVCVHPIEARISLAGMGEADEFQCRVCGLHVRAVPVTVHG